MGEITVFALILSLGIGVSLGMLGGGGSMLTVPLLIYVVGLEPKTGFATSTIVVGSTAIVALTQHARQGHVAWRVGGIFAVTSVLGSASSGVAAQWISGDSLMLLFAAMMLTAAVAMILGREGLQARAAHEVHTAELGAYGLGVGLLTGMVGAGGGFVIVPALVLLAGMEMHAAVATSLLVIALKSAGSLAGYASHAPVAWPAGAWVTVGAVAGSAIGARLAARASAQTLRRAFAALLIVLSFALAAREGDPAAVRGLLDLWPMLTALAAIGAALTLVRRWRSAPAPRTHDVP